MENGRIKTLVETSIRCLLIGQQMGSHVLLFIGLKAAGMPFAHCLAALQYVNWLLYITES
jgi:hypothetical protein